ncbi:N-acetylmuramoyl-L-alanine amidase [Prochlorococcus marinus]|uniref:N-acetylmuramoyl-L-alanine amidase n=1 Tax=Prochlorococcus marinus (strain MIT 9303) TaxID=59922 RepID=A2C9U3_PROM3|nr:peptidoglycan recognition family protein [Prochlorococcus marinus]ABM78253.1 N-acetylmuramoyl-L-alanine amidase (family 2) [Prochlorococcus marinus str. MIT 9303]
MVSDYLTTLIMSMSIKTKRFLIILILTLSGLTIFIWRTKYTIRDAQPKLNQSLQSHLERLGQFSEKYNPKSKDLPSTSQQKPPRAISWSSPLSKQCSDIDQRLKKSLNRRKDKLATERNNVVIDSSNYGKRYRWDLYGRRIDPTPSVVILHETTDSYHSALYTFKDYHRKDEDQVSYHTLITLDGLIIDVVDPINRAYGAGNSAFLGEWVVTNPRFKGSVNNFALHVSLETPWDGRNGYLNHSGYSNNQYDSLALVLADWMDRFNIPPENITTHQHVDLAGERSDPRSFDWSNLQQRLAAIGYLCVNSSPSD